MTGTAVMEIEDKQMLTVIEVSALLQIHPLTTRKMCQNGELPAIKIGRQWRFDPDLFNQWVIDRTTDNMAQKKSMNEVIDLDFAKVEERVAASLFQDA